MMLVICITCKKIIGCGITKDGIIEKECVQCNEQVECQEETPLGMIVERRVYFVRFIGGCSDHERFKIGFNK